jgi:hypothetical protein
VERRHEVEVVHVADTLADGASGHRATAFAFLGGLLRSHVSHLDAELADRLEELRASRAPVPVTVEADGRERVPGTIESAAYLVGAAARTVRLSVPSLAGSPYLQAGPPQAVFRVPQDLDSTDGIDPTLRPRSAPLPSPAAPG